MVGARAMAYGADHASKITLLPEPSSIYSKFVPIFLSPVPSNPQKLTYSTSKTLI
jgi:hypothetical protein